MAKIFGTGVPHKEWYSICSAHRNYKPDCPRCQRGYWVDERKQKLETLVYKYAYPLWYWWVNKPNSATRKRLESMFPKLKPKK